MPTRQLMVLLAAWCAMRFGELAELRRVDLDLGNGAVRIRRAVVWVDGLAIVGDPKSEAGQRDVAVPPHVMPAMTAHLAAMGTVDGGALRFPSTTNPTRHLQGPRVFVYFNRARRAQGGPDLRFHDLRHTGAVYATRAGASLVEVMARLGYSTANAACATRTRPKDVSPIADALSKLTRD